MPETPPLLLLVGDLPENKRRIDDLLQGSTVPIEVIRRQLWKDVTAIGLSHLLHDEEQRSPDQLVEQAQAMRENTPAHIPVALNLTGIGKEQQEKICSLLPDAVVLGPDTPQYLGHTVIQTREDLRALTPERGNTVEQIVPSKNILNPNLVLGAPRVDWDMAKLHFLLQQVSPAEEDSLTFDGIAPSFVYGTLAAASRPETKLTLHNPGMAGDPWIPLDIKTVKEGQDPTYPYVISKDSYLGKPYTRIDFTLTGAFDLKHFVVESSLVLPPLAKDEGVVISAKAPIAFLVTIARTLAQQGHPWVAIYAPPQVLDAGNFSPAAIVYPTEKIGYFESFPPDLIPRLLRGLSHYAQTPEEQNIATELAAMADSSALQEVDKELFRRYCSVFAASEYTSQIVSSGEPLLVSPKELGELMKRKAVQTIFAAVKNPGQAHRLIDQLETEYVTFGSLFLQYLKKETDTIKALKENRIPHLRFDVHSGALPSKEIAQVQQWYEENYKDQEFAHKVAEAFTKTDWEESESTHYRLYYSPTESHPQTGKLIGYMRISKNTAPEGGRYMGNLHIAPAFQGYKLMIPFFGTAMTSEEDGHFVLHAEPGSLAEGLYKDRFGFAITHAGEHYMNHKDSTPVYLDKMEYRRQ